MSQKKLQLHMAWKEKRRQQQLKAQYGIDRPDVVVVERKNVFVITLRVILHAAWTNFSSGSWCARRPEREYTKPTCRGFAG